MSCGSTCEWVEPLQSGKDDLTPGRMVPAVDLEWLGNVINFGRVIN